MPKLYIANGTKQNINLMYKLSGQGAARSQFIPAGQQLLVGGGDLTQDQVTYIIDQNKKYGLIEYRDIDRTNPFIGMCYSIDKPVPSPKMMHALEHNMDVLSERGQRNRELAAITANEALEGQLGQSNIGDLGAMEMTITEEGSGRDGNRPITERFRVTRHETTTARVETKAPTPKRSTRKRG